MAEKAIENELSDDTEDLVASMNNFSLSSSTSPDTIPGPDVKYGRLPYSPRSRSPSPHLRRSLSPRTRSPRLRGSRSRSVSPVLVKSSLRDRYGDPLYSPRMSDSIHNKVVRALGNEFVSSESDISSVTSEEALSDLRSTLRSSGHSSALTRSLLSPTAADRSISAEVNEGHHLSTRSYDLTGQSHRDLFEGNMNRIFKRLYNNIKSTP